MWKFHEHNDTKSAYCKGQSLVCLEGVLPISINGCVKETLHMCQTNSIIRMELNLFAIENP